ncbi:MAG: hypothetical protein EBT51_10445 [Flavobacteriaceae bacterium]|nr:hypothetical protein [Flavobacteriaceae bacterium]
MPNIKLKSKLLKVAKTNSKLVGFFINCPRQQAIIVEILMQSEAAERLLNLLTAIKVCQESKKAILCKAITE